MVFTHSHRTLTPAKLKTHARSGSLYEAQSSLLQRRGSVTSVTSTPACPKYAGSKRHSAPSVSADLGNQASSYSEENRLTSRVYIRKSIARKIRRSLQEQAGVEESPEVAQFRRIVKESCKAVHEVFLEENVISWWKESMLQLQNGAQEKGKERYVPSPEDSLLKEMEALAVALKELLCAGSMEAARTAMQVAHALVVQLTSLSNAVSVSLQTLGELGKTFDKQIVDLIELLNKIGAHVAFMAEDADHDDPSTGPSRRNVWALVVEHCLTEMGVLQKSLRDSLSSVDMGDDKECAAAFWRHMVGTDRISIGQELRNAHTVQRRSGFISSQCATEVLASSPSEHDCVKASADSPRSEDSKMPSEGRVADQLCEPAGVSNMHRTISGTPACRLDVPSVGKIEGSRLANSNLSATFTEDGHEACPHDTDTHAVEHQESTTTVLPENALELPQAIHEPIALATMTMPSGGTASAHTSSCGKHIAFETRSLLDDGMGVILINDDQSTKRKKTKREKSDEFTRVDWVVLSPKHTVSLEDEQDAIVDELCHGCRQQSRGSCGNQCCGRCHDDFSAYGLSKAERTLLASVVAEGSSGDGSAHPIARLPPLQTPNVQGSRQGPRRIRFKQTKTADPASAPPGAASLKSWKIPVDLPSLVGRSRPKSVPSASSAMALHDSTTPNLSKTP